MSFFNRNKDCQVATVGNEVATIQVRDIKQYLVEEYERSRNLERRLEFRERELEKAELVKMEYDAALVTLDEYKSRIDELNEKIEKEKARTNAERERAKKAEEEKNNCKIILNHTAREKESIKEEVIDEIKAEIVERIENFKGNLSKAKAIEIVKGEQNE